MVNLIPASLFVLAVGLLTSISLMTLFHLLILPCIIYYARDYSWKKFPKSAWALLGLSVVFILSVGLNHDSIARPWKNIFKVKYYVLGALSVIPFSYYFKSYLSPEKRIQILKKLLWTLFICSSLATLSGLIGYFTGFNPLRMAEVSTQRNGGLFGMVMTYGHSIAWLSLLCVSLCFHTEKIKGVISRSWLGFFTLVFLLGLFTSHVRGAWISFFVGCLAINKKVTAVLLLLCCLGVALMSFKDPNFIQTQIVRRGSNQERIGCWLGALAALKEKPILGYGYLNYEPHSQEIKQKYHLPEADFGGHAHNDLLEILATSGILGGLFFLGWIIFWFKEVWARKDLVTQLVIPIVFGFLASGLTQVTFNDGENAFFLMLVYALSLAY